MAFVRHFASEKPPGTTDELRTRAERGDALTSPKPLKFEKTAHDRIERVFIDHYKLVLGWARQVTHGNTEEAEDLVQELYVRLVQMKSEPELLDDAHFRGYVRRALNNLYISRKLRQGRDAISRLTVVEFDSLAFALASVDRSRLLYVRSDLARICEYVLMRRKTSKAATAFIMRFLLGYLPTEVMALMGIGRKALEALLLTSRLEAKAYIERPGVLRFLNRYEKKTPTFPNFLPEDSDELFAELQRRIFSEREGDCSIFEIIATRYHGTSNGVLSMEEAAHLGSCRLCLGNAGTILGIPDLAPRMFSNMEAAGGSEPPTPREEEDDLKKLHRKSREIFEHRPKKLHIAVDGEIRAVQTIKGTTSEFQIKLPPFSQPGFVEILSEQGARLLYLDLRGDSEPFAIKQTQIDFSEERLLTVGLSLLDGIPVIDVSYYDPLADVEPDQTPTATASIPMTVSTIPLPAGVFTRKERSGVGISSILTMLKRLLRLKLLVGIAIPLLVCLMLGLRLHKPKNAITVTAAAVLAQSAENSLRAIPAQGAKHSTYSVDVLVDGEGVESGKVDSLRDANSPRAAIHLLSGSGRLLAGKWTDANGKISKYQAAAPARSEIGGERLVSDDFWMHPPDPADFNALAGKDQPLLLSTTKDGYDVAFTRNPAEGRATVIEAHLALAAQTLRPVAETFRVQHGAERRDYTFRELSYDILQPDEVRDQDFQPVTETVMRGQRSFLPPHRASDQTQLVLGVLEILSREEEGIERSVDLERQSDGSLELSGVLSLSAQRQQLVHAIRSLSRGSQVRLDLHIPDEQNRIAQTGDSVVELLSPVSVGSGQHPAFDDLLRSVYEAQGYAGEELDQRVRASENEMIARGAQLQRETWQVGNVGAQYFSQAEIETMTFDEKTRWLSLLAQHLRRCHVALMTINTILATPDRQSPVATADSLLGNVADLRRSAMTLSQSGARLDHLIVEGFALLPDRPRIGIHLSEMASLLTEVEREERKLSSTIERLQQSIQTRTTD
jgi:DNA-directed RNA polymerase specialized sigma24 family protein